MPILDFDPVSSDYTPRTFEALPRGDYTAMITDSDIKETKAGNGLYVALTIEIIDGSYSGRKIWDNLNVKNPSVSAENIAMANLAQYFKSCGLNYERGADSGTLYNVPFKLHLDIDNKDPSRNRVMGSSRIGGAAPKPSAPTKIGQAKPWEK